MMLFDRNSLLVKIDRVSIILSQFKALFESQRSVKESLNCNGTTLPALRALVCLTLL
jgi:excinuclease UvrABC helicase subunit UvrB